MAGTGALVLLAIGLFCYVVGMVGVLVGMTGNSWFVYDGSDFSTIKTEEGLFKSCANNLQDKTVCDERSTLFKFKDEARQGEEKDIVISLLMACAVLCFVAFIISLVMICYRKRKAAWRCSAAASFVFSILSALIGLAALGYSESKFSDEWSNKKHGWSNILCWVGCAGIIIGSVLTAILIWVTPVSRGREKNTGVHYVGNMNPTYQHDYNTRY